MSLSREKWRAWNLRRHAENREFLNRLKSVPCFDCKGTFPTYVMEFDHVPERGPKKATISMLSGSRKITAPTLLAEIKKCDVVCANCHSIRTHVRGANGKSPAGETATEGVCAVATAIHSGERTVISMRK